MTKYLGFQNSDLSGGFLPFQQYSAPAQRAREIVQLLTCETPDFIGPAMWPANSTDLSLVDYRTCGKLQERVYQYHSRIHDVDQL